MNTMRHSFYNIHCILKPIILQENISQNYGLAKSLKENTSHVDTGNQTWAVMLTPYDITGEAIALWTVVNRSKRSFFRSL